MSETLELVFQKHVKREFPPHASSDALLNWQMKLLELDGYLVGLANSMVSGSMIELDSNCDPNELRIALGALRVPDGDGGIYRRCEEYIDGLCDLYQALVL